MLPLGASLDADPLNKQSSALARPPSQIFVPIPLPALTHRNSLFSSKGVTWLQYSPDRLLQESLLNTPCRPIDVRYLSHCCTMFQGLQVMIAGRFESTTQGLKILQIL
jgi:hypothetical protein